MKFWMTRDDRGGTTIELWVKEPTLSCHGLYSTVASVLGDVRLDARLFNSLTGLPLPRKGSKKRVEISLSIKAAV